MHVQRLPELLVRKQKQSTHTYPGNLRFRVSPDAVLCLQDMSSEGPLSSTDHAAPSLQAQEPASPRMQSEDEARQAVEEDSEASGDAEWPEEDSSARASLLSLDPETARAAQDVLDSEAEVHHGFPHRSELLIRGLARSRFQNDPHAGP